MSFLKKQFPSKPPAKTSQELLKEATQLKKSSDWGGAIDKLTSAYDAARQEKVSYGADVYLRLPKYLYEAGNKDEAWAEYNRALTEGFDGKSPPKELVHIEHSQIYGAMASQLKKEKKYFDSAIFTAASGVSWQKGMIAQKRRSELDSASMEKSIEQLLDKGGKKNILPDFIAIFREALSNPKPTQVSELMRRLNGLVQR
jgi:hypothetical protein